MQNSRFSTFIAGSVVIGLLYVGYGLRHPNESIDSTGFNLPRTMQPAYAGGVGVADENSETLFTCSEDGKTIYMWQYYSAKKPKFLSQAEAVLSE